MVLSWVNNKSLRSSGPQTFSSSILSISLPGGGVLPKGKTAGYGDRGTEAVKKKTQLKLPELVSKP